MAELVDWDARTLTPLRALVWLALSLALFTVMLPPYVSASPGLLTARGPLHRRTIRTDALVAVTQYDGVSSHLVLRDVHGHRLELDPRVLIANPVLWHELDTGARRSLQRGTLHQGSDVLRRLGHRIDDETALAVLRESGLS